MPKIFCNVLKSLFWKCFGEDGDIDFSVMRDKIYM